MPTEEERTRAKKGIKARQDAIKSLISNHQQEFDETVERNRLELGLSRRPAGATAEELQAKIKRAEERMAKWREELRQAS